MLFVLVASSRSVSKHTRRSWNHKMLKYGGGTVPQRTQTTFFALTPFGRVNFDFVNYKIHSNKCMENLKVVVIITTD